MLIPSTKFIIGLRVLAPITDTDGVVREAE